MPNTFLIGIGPIILEAVFVGLYSMGITWIFYPFIGWFGSGFMKHFLGYWLGIANMFCQLTYNRPFTTSISHLILWSIAEGVLFLVAALCIPSYLSPWLKPKVTVIGSIIGFSAHLVAEFLGIHRYFCTNSL
jgi:hypothetical protein